MTGVTFFYQESEGEFASQALAQLPISTVKATPRLLVQTKGSGCFHPRSRPRIFRLRGQVAWGTSSDTPHPQADEGGQGGTAEGLAFLEHTCPRRQEALQERVLLGEGVKAAGMTVGCAPGEWSPAARRTHHIAALPAKPHRGPHRRRLTGAPSSTCWPGHSPAEAPGSSPT